MLSIIIIGAGIGGLATAVLLKQSGHHVTVIERNANFLRHQSQAGLGLMCNATRCIALMGLAEELKTYSDGSIASSIINYANAEVVATSTHTETQHVVHRADLLASFYKRALNLGVEFLIGHEVTELEDRKDSVFVNLQNHGIIRADLVVGADGINSKTRTHVLGGTEVKPTPTDDSVFLITIPKSVMEQHESTARIYSIPPWQFWLAPGRQIVSWAMKKHDVYHLQMSDHNFNKGVAYGLKPSDNAASITNFTNMAAFQKRWSDFDESLRLFIGEVKSCIRWQIARLPDIERWSSLSGRVVLLGDAAHAFEPFAGQGGAMALEDTTALDVLLSRAPDPESIPKVTKAYESLRRLRIDGMRDFIDANVSNFKMTDSNEQMKGATTSVMTTERWAWVNDYKVSDEAQQWALT